METRLDKIVDEFAEVFWRMNWKWNTTSFKGVPGKDEIRKSIVDAITRLKGQGYDSYTSSGRIMVAKKLMKDEDGACWEYCISLDGKFIDENEIDEMLESSMETKG